MKISYKETNFVNANSKLQQRNKTKKITNKEHPWMTVHCYQGVTDIANMKLKIPPTIKQYSAGWSQGKNCRLKFYILPEFPYIPQQKSLMIL